MSSDKTAADHTRVCSGTGVITPTRIIRLVGNLDFGDVEVGASDSRLMTLFNDGNSDLTVTGISYPICVSGTYNGVIGAGKSENITMPFTDLPVGIPYTVNSYTGTVHGADGECFYRIQLQP